MSRSASDATRFTATAPHAYSKPSGGSFRSTAQSFQGRQGAGGSSGPPPPPGGSNGGGAQGPTETPQQKVARLRAAHAAKRAAEISTWDRVVMRGRTVADTAHRVTVVGLVGLSVVAGVITAYSFFDLAAYNRRKKREWLETQYANLQKELVEASRAERAGIATPEQMLLLNRERTAEQARREKEQRKGVFGHIKGLFSTEGLKKEEKSSFDGDELLRRSVEDAVAKKIPVAPVPDPSVPQLSGTEGDGPVTQALKQHRRQQGHESAAAAAAAAAATGGLLDEVAANAAGQARKTASSWSAWTGIFGGSK